MAVCISASESVHNGKVDLYAKVNVNGEANYDTAVVFCAYVIDNGTVYYLDNNTTSTTVAGISYNDVYEMLN